MFRYQFSDRLNLYPLRAPSFRLTTPATGLRRWNGQAKGWETTNPKVPNHAVGDLVVSATHMVVYVLKGHGFRWDETTGLAEQLS